MQYHVGLKLGFALLIGCTSYAGASSDAPLPVSPGSEDRITTTARSCPTFSWGYQLEGLRSAGFDGDSSTSSSFEIEVTRWQTGPTSGASEPLPLSAADLEYEDLELRVELPAGASSWTPGSARCLAPGGTYSWRIRATADGAHSGWSADHFFAVGLSPSVDEVAWAQDILRRHLAHSRYAEAAAAESGVVLSEAHSEYWSASASRQDFGEARTQNSRGNPNVSLNVAGIVESRGLTSVTAVPYSGDIIAEGNISAPTGEISAARLETADVLGGIRHSLVGTQSRVLLCGAADSAEPTPCELGAGNADGRLEVKTLIANEAIFAYGGIFVSSSATWRGTGGSGFFEVPSATQVKVDSNSSTCPGGGLAVGVRLAETDENQIGIQIKCTG